MPCLPSKRLVVFSAFLLLCLSGIKLQGKPELFPDAIKFGANDCSFCHQTAAGGTAINDRGSWLVAELIKRNVDVIDVNWLTDRGDEADESRQLDLSQESAAVIAEASESHAADEPDDRPFDYSTDWGEWPAYSGNLQAQKYSPLPHINKTSVNQLELAWIWEAEIDSGTQLATRGERRRRGGGVSPFKGTPLMVNGRVFVRTRYSTVVAINAETGEQLWEYDPGTRHGPPPPMFGFATRGLGYHRAEICDDAIPCDRIVLLASDGWLISVNPETGKVIESFGERGKVDLTKGLRRPILRSQVAWSHPPLVCNDVIVVGSQTNDMSQFGNRRGDWKENLPLGDVRGFDPITGKQVWVFKTVPQEGEVGNETWGNDSWKWMGNTNVWSTFSCDPELGYVYLPVTAPTDHMYGGNRPGDNLFGNSVVALNVKTGERLWHFQITHHDIWDFDLPAAPVVADIVVEGKPRKVVAQVTKMGYLFVFDRITGEPIWPVIERKVPPSTLKGEVASPTQPHPTKPPPFQIQGVTLEDLNDLTPEVHARAVEMIEGKDHGDLYTPMSEHGAVTTPGVGGGANWPGAAFDPATGQLYLTSRREAMIAYAVPLRDQSRGLPYREQWGFPKIDGLNLLKPPFSNVTAYDLGKGEIAWQVANGEGNKDHPLLKEVKDSLPDLGVDGANPGILVLPELIFMGQPDRQGRPAKLKALDPGTGEEVWSAPLRGYFNSPHPISYSMGSKQYISIATGHPFEPSRIETFAVSIKTTADSNEDLDN